ncbi:DUF6688 family protein [Capnocytophaga sp. oral taxon 338]|jgi:putative membrane protein|uniref:DUF6688 domain-containing protein n=1 Tax=Capnocytophaga sp. oral taxon 338 TaxID=710239 RepID=UPI000202B308|nr:DUF6688 family protein [Capnocytophaga sp. oral taxon 338]EGD34608.1 membrane protein [Capnocytophaga sp. oral taxon 338 str. F0234]
MFGFVFVLVILIAFLAVTFYIGVYLHKRNVPLWQYPIALLYVLCLLFFLFFSSLFGAEYATAIDPIDGGYAFISGEYGLTFMIYFLLYHIALWTLWVRKAKLPPLPLVLCLCFLYIGIVLNVCIASQLIGGEQSQKELASFPIFSTFIAILVIGRSLMAVREELSTKTFKNRLLNKLNTFLSSRFTVLTWSVVLVFPIFVLLTLLLMIFGQDYDAVVKGFTQTTTWAFSEKEHPPYLDHSGHYLCTVAACGSPRLVKPLRWGKRGGRPIIVNRQLQIANAFEELIADFSPVLHHFLRTNYDKYGYDLSQKIKTPIASNITYLLMKPLEWFFLLCLYTFCLHPERKIERQYME